MREILRPENFGFENNHRNWELFYTLSISANSYVYADDGESNVTPVLNVFRRGSDLSICEVNLDNLETSEQVRKSIGMDKTSVSYEYERFSKKGVYLVLRGFDRFVEKNVKEIKSEDVERSLQIMRLAEKHGHGTMVTFREAEVDDPWRKILSASTKSYFLESFVDNFDAMRIIR